MSDPVRSSASLPVLPVSHGTNYIPLSTANIKTRKIVMTMMVTNAILGGMADTVAQLVAAFNASASLKKGGLAKHDPLAIELHELDRKDGLLGRDFAGAALVSPFDFERLVRFMSYGLGMAPLQFKWFRFLEWMFPITKASAFVPAVKRVLVDQVVFSPCSEFFLRIPLWSSVEKGSGRWLLERLANGWGLACRYLHLLYRDDCCGRGWEARCVE